MKSMKQLMEDRLEEIEKLIEMEIKVKKDKYLSQEEINELTKLHQVKRTYQKSLQ